MVGIVIVSHSYRIAEGVAELAREMGGPDIRLETAGGLDMPDHPIGTDAVLVMQAIDRAWSEDGVLVLMDLGSAVLSAELALDLCDASKRERIMLCEAPLVEGAVAAAVTAKMGAALGAVAGEARGGLAGKIAHLGIPPIDSAAATDSGAGSAVTVRLTVMNPHGLHARPAARFVQTASAFDAQVAVRNLTAGRGPADARSLNAIATLGAADGHELEVVATGPAAAEAIEALRSLVGRHFDEAVEALAPATRIAEPPEPLGAGALQGHGASPGVAIGEARRSVSAPIEVPAGDATDAPAEIERLDRALATTFRRVAMQRDQAAAKAGEGEAEIFSAHLLFLRDDALLAPARRAIHAERRTAAQAWQGAVATTATAWEGIEDPYLRARASDLRSVGAQVLAAILDVDVPAPTLTAPGILVSADLTPADTAGLDASVVLGIVTEHGGPTSHAAVLARAMGIPAVVGVGTRVSEIEDGTMLALDGERGVVDVDPSPEVLAGFRAQLAARAEISREAIARAHESALTVDGTVIEVSANVGTPREVGEAVEAGADGIGLFRTELLFMDRTTMPSEDEQEHAYREAAAALDGRPLLLRTLDAGADKPLPYLGQPREENPFLGVRGVRLGLQRPELLRTQLRAVCRVAADFPIRVMFPMVATVDELDAVLGLLQKARARTGDPQLEVGVMIEVPAAALTATALAARVDFFSIGTNDLTQYALAADRGNEHVASLSDALHPAVLGLIASTVEGARMHDRWVGVCGELAADPVATELLLGLGVRELSMATSAVPLVKQAVRGAELGRAGATAARARSCTSAAQVHAVLGA